MQEQHLRPVPPVDQNDGTHANSGGGQSPGSRPQAAKARPRPAKALPTDRMKLEVQKKALSVIAILSGYGKEGVTSADMAPRLGVAATTAGLNNSFFADCGLILRDGKGRYKSSEAANDFARKFSFDADRAGLALRNALSETWFFAVVSQQIEGMGPTPKTKLIELLAYEAGTNNDYRVQLTSLISWLEYAGLIEADGDVYELAEDVPSKADEDGPGDEVPKGKTKDDQPDPNPEGATKAGESGGQLQQTDAILGFSFEFALTGDDLAKLSPEQITALFNAVGEVMAIKAALA